MDTEKSVTQRFNLETFKIRKKLDKNLLKRDLLQIPQKTTKKAFF
jgi:hypothetical protein